MKYQKGQIGIATALISAVGLVSASGLTAWATASSRLSSVDSKVDVVQERENNHYLELRKDLSRIETKLDHLIDEK